MPPITLKKRYQYNPDTDLLGTGGMGAVYKAYDNEHEHYVAIKKFNAADSLKYSLKAEFQKSIHFSHGNLVRAYDFFSTNYTLPTGETHETQYGVMELIAGGDLAKYLKTKPPLPELLEVVKGILRGLAYLHTPDPNTDKGIVIHRDIKPANILIFRNNQGKPIPKITDFNIAKDATHTLSTVTVVGTPEYMSPEQILPNTYAANGKLLPNTDLWALGVLLCDHLLNKSTFGKRTSGLTPGEITHNVLTQPLPTTDIQNLPAPFNQMVAQCLVRDAQQRIQSAEDLLKLIGRYENSVEETVIVSPLPPPKPKPRVVLEDTYVPVNLPPINPQLPTPIQHLANNMVLVEGGTFMMGEEKSFWDFGKDNVAHKVNLSSFWISKYLVTQQLWEAVMGTSATLSNPSYFKGSNLPVERVSWDDAVEFCHRLSSLTGKNYRLPTEAQWEYAARGGHKSSFDKGGQGGFKYAGSNNLNEVAWYGGNSSNKTHPVGQKLPNELGLYDMSGNVWEWCQDWYDADYYKKSPANNPTGPTSGSYRVLRGGSWNSYAQYCRAASGNSYTPSLRNYGNGFRLVFLP